MSADLRVLSLGAGVQSSTLALMIEKGLVPKVDLAVFADTKSEPAAVYKWLEWLQGQVSFPINIVTAGSLKENAKKSNEGIYVRGSTIPMYVRHKETGKKGILRRMCTATYKIEPVTKEIRRLLGVGYKQRVPKGKKVQQIFGISKDEIVRMRISQYHYIDFEYPLVDHNMTRKDCLQWMKDNGYPQPPRSACTFCPYHSNAEWLRIKNETPDEWAEVVALDKQLRTGFVGTNKDENNYYLHRSGKPLDEVDFEREKNKEQLDFEFGMDNECEGMCGV
jgi:hypothetical protein